MRSERSSCIAQVDYDILRFRSLDAVLVNKFLHSALFDNIPRFCLLNTASANELHQRG